MVERIRSVNFNIKNPMAHKMATELARLTGESLSEAATMAIRERLERERRQRDNQALARELLEMGRRFAAHGRTDQRSHGEFLYDERGLPD